MCSIVSIVIGWYLPRTGGEGVVPTLGTSCPDLARGRYLPWTGVHTLDGGYLSWTGGYLPWGTPCPDLANLPWMEGYLLWGNPCPYLARGYLPWMGVPTVDGGTYLGQGVPTLGYPPS